MLESHGHTIGREDTQIPTPEFPSGVPCELPAEELTSDVRAASGATYVLCRSLALWCYQGLPSGPYRHSHTVTFTALDFETAAQGTPVTRASQDHTSCGGHHHDVTIQCSSDGDEDGAPDHVELERGSDPADADTDDDGLLDGADSGQCSWSTCLDPLLPDSDGDGLFDGTELGLPCDHPDTLLAAGHCVPDGDAGATTTDPGAADTDGDETFDGAEDSDHDGVIDPGETDPNDSTDS